MQLLNMAITMLNASTIFKGAVSLCCFVYSLALPVLSMPSDQPFDFKIAAAIAREIERAWNHPVPIKDAVPVVRFEVHDGQQKISFVQSSGVESIDSGIRSAVETAISKQTLPQNLSFDFSFQPINEEDPRNPSLTRFRNRVLFRPPQSRPTGNSPTYPSYFSDGKPDLVWYKFYLERKVGQRSADWEGWEDREPVLVDLVIHRTQDPQATLYKSCGNSQHDKSALQALLSINYERLPDPGPARVRFRVAFGRYRHVLRMNAEYD